MIIFSFVFFFILLTVGLHGRRVKRHMMSSSSPMPETRRKRRITTIKNMNCNCYNPTPAEKLQWQREAYEKKKKETPDEKGGK